MLINQNQQTKSKNKNNNLIYNNQSSHKSQIKGNKRNKFRK